MKANIVKALLWTSLLLPVVGAGVLIGAWSADDGDRVVALERANARLSARAARLADDRSLLRADRDQLERRLAARAPRAICPETYVSTADVDLLPWFEVEYRCGWHVLYDARPQRGTEERPGATLTLTLFSRLPLRLGATARAADIELADWTDDANEEGDGLPPLSRWLEDERDNFEQPARERRLEAADGTTIYELRGSARVGEDSIALSVLLWEFEDTDTGARHVVRAAAVDPSEQTRAALTRLGRSFRALTPE